jgi:ATP-dependent DNA ligase
MLARLERELPFGDFFYEPKWDGFRCIVFRHGSDIELASRNELSLTRYFPELVEVLGDRLPGSAVLDGEIVIAGPAGLDFDALSQRVHPADSRVQMLAQKTPASFVAFDLIALGDQDLRGRPFDERRRTLEEVFAGVAKGAEGLPGVHLTPATRDVELASDWFHRFEGAGLDGVVAKSAGQHYVAGKRLMVKVKHSRTAEFVVAGFRWHKSAGAEEAAGAAGRSAKAAGDVGSLMLGLYGAEGQLSHVGVIGAFGAQQRRELVDVLAPYRLRTSDGPSEHPWAGWSLQAEGPDRRLPGARSRWNAGKDLSFVPLRPELVVEAAYEHLQGDRLRHTAQFRRWRPDRTPLSCTYEQLGAVVPVELAEVFGAGVVMEAGTQVHGR